MNPTRWLLMAGHVPASGQGGGIVRYTVELARALSRRDDVELSLLTAPEVPAVLAELTDRVEQLPGVPDPAGPAYERTLLGRQLGTRYDVVQGTKHLLPRGVAARTVLTVHDMLLFDRPADFGLAKRVLLRAPYAGSLRQADRLVCVSAATLAQVSRWAPQAAPRGAVVPLATSPTLRSTPPVPVPEVAGRPFALVVGDSQPRKNLPVVMAAWARVVRDRPDAVLVQVGPPAWGEQSYGPEFDGLVAAGHVLPLQSVDDGVLRWLYEQAAVVLAPSLAEGFGLPAAEALDLGAPLVTSLDAALVEVSGDTAEHLPADDVAAWTTAALRHLGSERPRPAARPARTWDDVAAETVRAVAAR